MSLCEKTVNVKIHRWESMSADDIYKRITISTTAYLDVSSMPSLSANTDQPEHCEMEKYSTGTCV